MAFQTGIKGRSFTYFKILVVKGEINSVLRKLTAQSGISWHYPFINSIAVLIILTPVPSATCNMA